MPEPKQPDGPRTGLGVDRSGGPVVDPTENVAKLNEASNKRQDDLRDASDRFNAAALSHVKELAKLRDEHYKEIRDSEAKRGDSVRRVDVEATKTEWERAQQAIQTLASQTTVNAENLRNALNSTAVSMAKQVSDTAIATAKQTADSFGEITTRIAALEKAYYEGKGKEAVSDPMMAELVSEMKILRESRNVTAGKGEGVSNTWAIIGAVLGTLAGIALVGIGIVGIVMGLQSKLP
jgi:hypothetical protein